MRKKALNVQNTCRVKKEQSSCQLYQLTLTLHSLTWLKQWCVRACVCVCALKTTFCHFLKLTLYKYCVCVHVCAFLCVYLCVSPSVSVTPRLIDCQPFSANILVKFTVCVCNTCPTWLFSVSYSVCVCVGWNDYTKVLDSSFWLNWVKKKNK